MYRTEADVLRFCLTLPGAYEDHPFDPAYTAVRHVGNRKLFLLMFAREGALWLNVKADPLWSGLWRAGYPAVRPAYHMNKEHWNSLVMDGSIPDALIEEMIVHSHALTRPKLKHPLCDGGSL